MQCVENLPALRNKEYFGTVLTIVHLAESSKFELNLHATALHLHPQL